MSDSKSLMTLKLYTIALTIDVESFSYEEALTLTVKFVSRLGQFYVNGSELKVVKSFEHDNDGQRVLYLHPEDQPNVIASTMSDAESSMAKIRAALASAIEHIADQGDLSLRNHQEVLQELRDAYAFVSKSLPIATDNIPQVHRESNG